MLNAAFALADDRGLLLLDLKDLRAILQFVADNAKEMQQTYGNIAPATVGAIQRNLLVLEREGGTTFFGEPSLALTDLMSIAADGRGSINILAADKLINKPRLYATFLLVAAVRAVRGAAGGGRPRPPEAGAVLRRGAPAVR